MVMMMMLCSNWVVVKEPQDKIIFFDEHLRPSYKSWSDDVESVYMWRAKIKWLRLPPADPTTAQISFPSFITTTDIIHMLLLGELIRWTVVCLGGSEMEKEDAKSSGGKDSWCDSWLSVVLKYSFHQDAWKVADDTTEKEE